MYSQVARVWPRIHSGPIGSRPWRWLPFAALLLLPLLWRSLVAAPQLRVDVGEWGDHTFLSGVNDIESSSTETYRWTTSQTTLTMPNLGAQYQQLVMRAHGWRPSGQPSPRVQISVMGRPWGSLQTTPSLRVYHILLPRDSSSPTLQVGFASQVYAPPGDARVIGFALDWLELRALGQPAGPGLWQMAGQSLLLALLALLLIALALPDAWALALALALGLAQLWANFVQPLWVSQALLPWLILVALLLLATWLLEPRLRRALAPWMSAGQARLAWALLVAALGLRLAGSVHPLFNAHDIDVHTGWLETVGRGQLYLFSTPGEFRGQTTFNPPAGYVLMLPLALLLPSSRLVVQVGVALLDALGCLAILGLARELRLSATAALLALGLYLALPINTTMLWWGFATNAQAQALWLLLLWSLLRLLRNPTHGALALSVVLSAMAMLTHVGALVLTMAVLGLFVLLGWTSLPARGRNTMLAGLALALLFALPIYFMAVVGPVLSQFSAADKPTSNLSATLATNWAQRNVKLNLVARGFVLGFLPVLLALSPLALARLLRARTDSRLRRRLVIAWLIVCLTFMLSYLSLSLLTRYIYFVAPLLCLALGALLAALWRAQAGRVVALALLLFVSWAGVSLWVEGVLMRVKPAVVSLTH